MEATLNWGNLKRFNQEHIDDIPDGTPGIYRLSYKDTDENYYVFYVSQSEDIKKELTNHLKQSENTCVSIKVNQKVCAFRVAECNDEVIRKAAARLAYKHYQPACNDSEPDGQEDWNINLE